MTDAASELEWMNSHLECLYVHDARGRMLRANQMEGLAAPLFHLGRTRLGNVWRFHVELGPEPLRALARLFGRETALATAAEAVPEPERLEACRRVLADAGVRLGHEHRGPAFHFPERVDAPDVEVASLDGVDASALAAPFEWVAVEIALDRPAVGAVRDGRLVCVCHCARGSPDGVVEAGVDTLPAYRGRGLASAAVAGWADAVRRRGGVPLYSTGWDNLASRGVARRLGLVPYGEDCNISEHREES